jgi:hypothetical protein
MTKETLTFVTYCGLHCDLCGARARTPVRAEALHQSMYDEGWPFWGAGIPGFKEFWEFLESLFVDGGCTGCRAGGGPPHCRIRACARERGLDLCSQCPDFPCAYLEALNAAYPMLITDNLRMQRVGAEQWNTEQQERARRGVVYADIRYQAGEGVLDEVFGGAEEDESE